MQKIQKIQKIQKTLLLCAVVVGFGIAGATQAQAGEWSYTGLPVDFPKAERLTEMTHQDGIGMDVLPGSASDSDGFGVTGTYAPDDPNDTPTNVTFTAGSDIQFGALTVESTVGGAAIAMQDGYADLSTDNDMVSDWPYRSEYVDGAATRLVGGAVYTKSLQITTNGEADVYASVYLSCMLDCGSFGETNDASATAIAGTAASTLTSFIISEP